MSNLIARPFSITRDFRSIMWGSTLWYNLLRSACAGLVLGILMTVFPNESSSPDRSPPFASGIPLPIVYLIMWPISYLIVLLPMGIVFSWLSSGSDWFGLISGFLALIAVTLGDPIVCILHKFAPKLVPVARPPFISFQMIFFVLRPDETDEIAVAR